MPYNWYGLRKIGLYFDNSSKQTIMPKQKRSFEVDDKEHELRVKLDFLRAKIEIPAGNDDVFITIGAKGESPVQWFLNSLLPNGLKMCIVSKSEFDEFDNCYSKTTVPIKGVDGVSFILTFGVVVYLVYSLFSTSFSEDASQLVWATTIIVATLLLVLWKDRRKVSKSSYKTRMILNSVFLFVVVISLSMQGFLSMGWLIALLPITVLMRTLVFENENLNGVVG